MTDGSSNTILIAERYAYGCNKRGVSWLEITGETAFPPISFGSGAPAISFERSPLFGDINCHDFLQFPDKPVPTVTFQTAPRIEDCDHRQLQASQPSGLLVALADGSVRTISSTISNTTFWASVTPAGGEVLGNDW